jgi:hypothetical protein
MLYEATDKPLPLRGREPAPDLIRGRRAAPGEGAANRTLLLAAQNTAPPRPAPSPASHRSEISPAQRAR